MGRITRVGIKQNLVRKGNSMRSEFSQNAVYNPVHRSGTRAVAAADGFVLEVFHYLLDEWKLHIRRIGHDEFLASFLVLKYDGLVSEDGEGK